MAQFYGAKTQSTVQVQVLQAIQTATANNIEVRLEPEELGKLRILMTPRESGLQVLILAERPETLDLMRRNMNGLVSQFSDGGFENPQIDFGAYGESDATEDGKTIEFNTDDFDENSPETTLGLQHPDIGNLDIRL